MATNVAERWAELHDRAPARTLFFSNLDPSIDSQNLRDTFERFGVVKLAEIAVVATEAVSGFAPCLELLEERGLEMVIVEKDGNCLFRAVSTCLWGSDERHLALRGQVADRMLLMKQEIAPFLESTTVEKYVQNLRHSKFWAGHLELSVIQILFKRRVQIVDADTLTTRKIEIGTCLGENDNSNSHSSKNKAGETDGIHLVYHGGSHYNAAVPRKPISGNVGPSLTEKLNGSMGLCVFSDASSVKRLLSLKPLFILRREVRMSATPWPDLPVLATLHSTEASSCSSSSETAASSAGTGLLREKDNARALSPGIAQKKSIQKKRSIPTLGAAQHPTNKIVRGQRPLRLGSRRFAQPSNSSIVTWFLEDRWRAVATLACLLVVIETCWLMWFWVHDKSHELVALDLRIRRLAAALDNLPPPTGQDYCQAAKPQPDPLTL